MFTFSIPWGRNALSYGDGFNNDLGFPHGHVSLVRGWWTWRCSSAPKQTERKRQKKKQQTAINTHLKAHHKKESRLLLVGFFDVETGRQKTVQLINTATGCWRITFRSKFGKASLKSIAALVWNRQFTPACTLLSNALHRWEEKIIFFFFFSPQYGWFRHSWVCASFETCKHNKE